MNSAQRGFTVWFVIIPVALLVIGSGLFVSTRHKGGTNNMDKYAAPNNPELTTLMTPYYKISDMGGIGPYSSNKDIAGYVHNGIDFMSDHDLVEYRAISGGIVIEAKVFYDSTRTDTHPQVNVIVLYNKTTKVVYTFEPYSKSIADAERQLTLLNVKEGDTIVAGQSLGKLIKTAPQSHVHIHVMKNEQAFCFENMFSKADKDELTSKIIPNPKIPEQLCYE